MRCAPLLGQCLVGTVGPSGDSCHTSRISPSDSGGQLRRYLRVTDEDSLYAAEVRLQLPLVLRLGRLPTAFPCVPCPLGQVGGGAQLPSLSLVP